MKNRLFFLFLALLPLLEVAIAQEVYKGQILVTKQSFSQKDNQLHVEMNVDYERLAIGQDESVTLTPVIRSGSKCFELPSVVINSPQKQKVYYRKVAFNSKKHSKKKAKAIAAVIKNNDKKSRTYAYKADVPFEAWMTEGGLFVETKECGCNGKTAQTYEDKVSDAVKIVKPRTSAITDEVDRKVLAWINILAPLPETEKKFRVEGSIPLVDNHGLFSRNSDEKQNYEIYYRLRDAIRDIRRETSTTITAVKVTGYTAPIGNLRKNEKNSLDRSLALKDYLRTTGVVGKSPLEVTWVAEDWDSITSLVKGSDMILRDAVLDIIQSVDVVKGRENILMDLADGVPYKFMTKDIFPKVKRVKYQILYDQQEINAEEGKLLIKTRPNALSLSEFFAVANTYPKGSTEYNDVFDLAARLFPDDAVANINAAAVALTKKDTKRARKYLERFATLPAASCNMGILNLLEGNLDKAEVYLEMASASGVVQAADALEYIRNTKKK